MRRSEIRSWRLAVAALALLAVAGCAEHWGSAPAAEDPLDPRYRRPYYREYGPWDLPSQSGQPGPPTWYGCPQGSRACFPD